MSVSSLEVRVALSVALVLFGFANYLPIVKLHGAYPLAVMWPSSLLKIDLRGFSGLVAAIVFWFSSGQVLRGTSPPFYLALTGVAVTMLGAIYFAVKWSEGLGFQGYAHTVFWASINALAALCLGASIVIAWPRPGGIVHLVAHFILIAWLAFVAFPFLGRPPYP